MASRMCVTCIATSPSREIGRNMSRRHDRNKKAHGARFEVKLVVLARGHLDRYEF